MRRRARDWPAALGLVSASALLAVVLVERGLGIAPCELCLLERWPWRVTLAIAVVALVAPRARPALRALALVTLAVSVGLGVLHTGVEWHAWPSPFPECRAPAFAGGSIEAQLAALPAHAAKPCDAATYLLPGVPISLAEGNLLLSAIVLAILGLRPAPCRTLA